MGWLELGRPEQNAKPDPEYPQDRHQRGGRADPGPDPGYGACSLPPEEHALVVLPGGIVPLSQWLAGAGLPLGRSGLGPGGARELVGAFFGLFLPTGVGGDAVKMYELSRDEGKAATAISSVLLDRFLGLFVLFALALLTLLIGYEMVIPQVRILIATVFVGALIIVALLIQRTWIEALGRWLGLDRLFGRFQILRDLYASIHIYGPQALFKGLVASLVWNLILILGYYLLGLAVGSGPHGALGGWAGHPGMGDRAAFQAGGRAGNPGPGFGSGL